MRRDIGQAVLIFQVFGLVVRIPDRLAITGKVDRGIFLQAILLQKARAHINCHRFLRFGLVVFLSGYPEIRALLLHHSPPFA